MMLMKAAEDDERSGNFTEAQQKYSEAAKRLRYSRPEEANRAQQGALRNAGAVLGIDAAASVVGDQPSPQLVERLQRFQRDANLPVTGTLDEQTQERLLKRGAAVPGR
jgi:predicted nucleotidyltransferase